MAPRDYERIWLTGGGFSEEGVAWCDERIEDDDVEYVNARLFNAQAERIAELEVAVEYATKAIAGTRQDADACIAGLKVRIAKLEAACRAALDWYGPDGDHIHDPAHAQLLRALGLPSDYAGRDLLEHIAELEALVKELADEVEASVKHEYGQQVHPSQVWRYERDMAIVVEARAALEHKEA